MPISNCRTGVSALSGTDMIPHARSRRGIRPVEVSKPKARGRGATRADERIHYSSSILPKWARRTKSLDILLPALYLRGVSTGDFQDVLTALLGKDAPNLSPSVIGRLKSDWEDDYRRWQASDLSARRYVYVWADGVYLQARMEPQAECILVLIGATRRAKRKGRLKLAQCTWVPAMAPWRATEEGFVSDAVVACYERLARGRPGAIVVEATGVRDVPSGPLLRVGH